jgi:hypothetical protein
LTENGFKPLDETTDFDNFVTDFNFQAKHTFVNEVVTKDILKHRLRLKKTPDEHTTLTPSRGGITTVWPNPLGTITKFTQDTQLHWHTIELQNNTGKRTKIISIYNNNKKPMSEHPYDHMSGNDIINTQIKPEIDRNSRSFATVLGGDFNLTENDVIFRHNTENPTKLESTRKTRSTTLPLLHST